MFCYPGWSTCKKARDWLEAHGISYKERNIKTENPKKEELLQWNKQYQAPLEKFFNTSGVLYRRNELALKLPTMSQEEMADWLGSDGMLVKRPLLIGPNFVLNGFKETEWEQRLL